MMIVGHTAPVTCMEVAGLNDTLVVSGSADGLLRVWDTRYDVTTPCATLKGHSDRVRINDLHSYVVVIATVRR
jgi:WD40 repeat protein